MIWTQGLRLCAILMMSRTAAPVGAVTTPRSGYTGGSDACIPGRTDPSLPVLFQRLVFFHKAPLAVPYDLPRIELILAAALIDADRPEHDDLLAVRKTEGQSGRFPANITQAMVPDSSFNENRDVRMYGIYSLTPRLFTYRRFSMKSCVNMFLI